MLWIAAIVAAIIGGHWAWALFYAATAMTAQRPGRIVLTLRQAPPKTLATPYEAAVERQRRRPRAINGGKQ